MVPFASGGFAQLFETQVFNSEVLTEDVILLKLLESENLSKRYINEAVDVI